MSDYIKADLANGKWAHRKRTQNEAALKKQTDDWLRHGGRLSALWEQRRAVMMVSKHG